MSSTNQNAPEKHHALIVGQGSLATAISQVLSGRGIAATISESNAEMSKVLTAAATECCPISLIFNTWFPDPQVDTPEMIGAYPHRLLKQCSDAQATLAAAHPSAAIINFAFLPTIYVGTALEDSVAALRGGITGVTRTLARKFGRQGIRVTCVQSGLLDLPETQNWVSDIVRKVQVPVKRWAHAEEVAKFMVFLGIDSLYTTGQTMIIDGGLTAGITGT